MDFDLAIELNPYSAPSYFNRGNLHCSLGNHSTAEQDYKKGECSTVNNVCWLLLSKQSFYKQIAGQGNGVDDHKVG